MNYSVAQGFDYCIELDIQICEYLQRENKSTILFIVDLFIFLRFLSFKSIISALNQWTSAIAVVLSSKTSSQKKKKNTTNSSE